MIYHSNVNPVIKKKDHGKYSHLQKKKQKLIISIIHWLWLNCYTTVIFYLSKSPQLNSL